MYIALNLFRKIVAKTFSSTTLSNWHPPFIDVLQAPYLVLEVYVQLDLYCFGSKDWKGRTADAALARLDSDNSHSGCTL